MNHPANLLRFERQRIIPEGVADRVHETGKRVLQDVGIQIMRPDVLERLQRDGLKVSGDRVFLESKVVEEYVVEMRRYLHSAVVPEPAQEDSGRLTLSTSIYPLYVHDIDTDEVVSYTTERLVQMCKLMSTLASEGVRGTPPGIPCDEHPDLQQIAQLRIAALYAPEEMIAVEPTSAKTVHHFLDMAEIMGRRFDTLPVYIPTPLRLGGDSLDVVLSCLNRIKSVRVSSMPSVGASAPQEPFGALVLAVAELMGAMVVMRIVTQKPVFFRAAVWPFDLRTGAMVLGSPEHMLFQMLRSDFNTFYGHPWDPAVSNIHVMAKQPDAQAAAERAAIMVTGAFLGARRFGCAGTLGLDEIFSPEQLLVDCEIRDWVQRSIRGVWMGEEVVDDWVEEIAHGLRQGFTALDSTLDHYRRDFWYPRRFNHDGVGLWRSKGYSRLPDRLRDEVRRRIAAYNFELDAARRRKIERITSDARRAVSE